MKKFFSKLALAVGCLGLVTTLSCIYISLQTRETMSLLAILPEETTVLALGDSHIEQGVDPEYFLNMVNCAKGGEHIFNSYAKLLFYTAQNPNIHTVIISANHFSLGRSHRAQLNCSSPSLKGYYPLVNTSEHLVEYHREIVGKQKNNRVYFLQELPTRIGFPNKTYLNEIFTRKQSNVEAAVRGGFEKYFETNLKEQAITKRLEDYYGDFEENNPDSYFQEVETKLFEDFLKFATARNLKVVLLSTPNYYKYNEGIPKYIVSKSDSLYVDFCERYDAIYLNYSHYQLPDSCFRDQDHLNVYGAAVITPMLRDTLQKLGVIR